jgi:hypothetical protein
MKVLLQTSTLLLGASIFTFAKAHEVRSPLEVFSDVERDAASLKVRNDDSYGRKKDHSGGGGWKGGSYEYKGYGSQDGDDGYGGDEYGNDGYGDDGYGDDGYGDDGYGSGGNSKSTTTVIINVTEVGTYGMGTVTAAGEETMTISVAAVSTTGSGQQGTQAS